MSENILFPAIMAPATGKPRTKRTAAQKLAIIAEYLRGETADAVQRRHGLGHSTLNKWLEDFGIVRPDGSDARKAAALEKENARLAAKVAGLEAALRAERQNGEALLAKIRAAKTALILTPAAPAPATDEDEAQEQEAA